MTDVLTVNAGSTSVKVVRLRGEQVVPGAADLDAALDGPAPDAVVHRVVHGGDRSAPAIVDDALLRELRALTDLAPLHQPPALDAIDRCRRGWPGVRQVACFDTSFHTTMPAAARTYALPARLRERVKVYGFHGLSHAWSTDRVGRQWPEARRMLIAHLGGGQSLCGVAEGRSVVTTMGFTPLDGLVMATRSGTIDPGALVWLVGHVEEDLGDVLETQSGLLGLCGTSDMRTVVERADADQPEARLALDVWTHRFLREAGGVIAVLGGLDALVFTGGVGEHSAVVRARCAAGLRLFGVEVRDDDAATEDLREISAARSSARTFVVHAREDLQMVRDAAALLGA